MKNERRSSVQFHETDLACAIHAIRSTLPLMALLFGVIAAGAPAWSQDAANALAPKVLFDASAAGAEKLIPLDGATADELSVKIESNGIVANWNGSDKSNYPGFNIMPASGASWDLSAYGHVEAKVTNTGAKPANITLRVDNAGDYHDNPWSCEFLRGIKPGETKTIKVIFGYSYGFNPNYKIKPEAIVKLLIFSDKSPDDRSFRIEQIQAAGPAGEKPAVNPANIRNAPDNGMILGKGVAIDAAKQIQANGGAKGTMADGSLRIDFEGKKDQSVTLRPAAGSWDLTQYLQVKVALKNTGQAPITPKARVDCGKGSPTNVIAAAAPLAPSAETEIIVPFAALVPWQAEKEEGKFKTLPGTGNTFHSGWVNGVTILSDKTDGAKSLLVTSIVAEAPVAVLPDWLGKRPPVEGEWVQTFSEEFDNPTIDLKRWNIYTNNYWDNRTHFSKDNTYIKDGKLILHFEKKKGYQNDNPKEKQTDYACGFADTYGKWVQRYGYWESRMKMTKAPGLWGAFWLMPDRGAAAKGGRSSTSNGGMEFDIQEFLDGWGPNRYNIAVHWDDYGPKHKSTGTPSIYFPPDKDGYMTAGLLWTPGLAVWYAQGKEVARWENPRVSTVQSYIMFDLVTGGWDNTPLEDSKLPDDYVIDYVRVWQRKDLASPVDGPQPNKGLPSSLEP